MLKKFIVSYEEELPGWDECGKIRYGSDTMIALSEDDAKFKFKSIKNNKYKVVTHVSELNSANVRYSI